MIMKIHGIVIFVSQYIYYTRVFCPQCLLPKTRRIETCYQNLGLFWFYFVFTSKWLLPPPTVMFKDNEWGYDFLVWHSRTFQAPPKSFRHKQFKTTAFPASALCIRSSYTVLLEQAALALRKPPPWQQGLRALKSANREVFSKHLS